MSGLVSFGVYVADLIEDLSESTHHGKLPPKQEKKSRLNMRCRMRWRERSSRVDW